MRRKVGVLLLAGITISCWLGFMQTSVAAAASGYPYADKPCVHAPYTAQGSGAQWCKNYDWGDRRNDTSASNVISLYGYYYRNCTDYVAWKLDSQGVAPAQYKGLGDAKRWATPPPKNGLYVTAEPAVGAVGVRTSGTYGHVAYVEEVTVAGHPPGTIRVSQYNKHADGTFSTAIGTPAALGFTHFVHFEAFMPSPLATAVTPTAVPAIIAETSAEAPAAKAPATLPESFAPEPTEPERIGTAPSEQPVTVSQLLSSETEVRRPAAAAAPVRAPIVPEPAPKPAASTVSVETAADPLTPASQSQPVASPPPPKPSMEQVRPAPTSSAPPASAAPPVAILRSAGFASIVVPYQWWQPPLPAPPSIAASQIRAGVSPWTALTYGMPVLLLAASVLPSLQGYRQWFTVRSPRPLGIQRR